MNWIKISDIIINLSTIKGFILNAHSIRIDYIDGSYRDLEFSDPEKSRDFFDDLCEKMDVL